MCATLAPVGEVASRELRNDTRGVLRRVEAGEHVVITVDGRPVAVLACLEPGPRPDTDPDAASLPQRRLEGIEELKFLD